MLQEQLEEERDFGEGIELLEPHVPALGERSGLPELQRSDSDLDDLGYSTFGLKLCKEAHLWDIVCRNLLHLSVGSITSTRFEFLQRLDLFGILEDFLSVILEVKDAVQVFSATLVLQEQLVDFLHGFLGKVRDGRAAKGS